MDLFKGNKDGSHGVQAGANAGIADPATARLPDAVDGDQASLHRIAVAEGPAWSAQGRYLLWSDIPNNRQMRWSEDDGRVSVSAHHLTTPTATRSTSRAGSSPANISREGLCATSTTARCRCSPTASTAKSSTRPTISSPIPMAATGSPIRPMAASSTRASRTLRAASDQLLSYRSQRTRRPRRDTGV